jgi:hypothetical protein
MVLSRWKVGAVLALSLLTLGLGLVARPLLAGKAEDARPEPPKRPAQAAAPRPSAEARKLIGLLKANLDSFGLRVQFLGGLKEPFGTVELRTAFRRDRGHADPHWAGSAVIPREAAAKVIDHLAAAGFFDRARVLDRAALDGLPQPCYLVSVWANQVPARCVDFGWDLSMVERLQGLRKQLGGEAAKVMDKVLAPLQPQQQLWEKAKALKKQIAQFALEIRYRGKDRKDRSYPSLLLSVPAVKAEGHQETVVAIDRAQAARLIASLSDLRSAARRFAIPRQKDLPTPSYGVSVRPADPAYTLYWRWGPGMIQALDDIRRELSGEAAPAMDKLLRAVEPKRKKWPGAAEGEQTSAWGKERRGLQCRVEAPTRLEQGMPLGVWVELRSAPQKLGKARRLNAFLPTAFLELSLTNRKTGKVLTVRPDDPTRGMPVQDTGRKAVVLDGTSLRPYPVTFPLVRLGSALEPGSYDAEVIFAFPDKPTRWWRGTAQEWDRAGFWHGTVRSGRLRLEVRPATPRKETYLLPKTLRLEKGLEVRYRPADAEKVMLPVRNGYFVGARFERDGQEYMLATRPPGPDAAHALDRWRDYQGGDRKVTYTIVVFETADPPRHGWAPGPGSGGYKVLWKKSFTLSQTEKEIRKLLAAPPG